MIENLHTMPVEELKRLAKEHQIRANHLQGIFMGPKGVTNAQAANEIRRRQQYADMMRKEVKRRGRLL